MMLRTSKVRKGVSDVDVALLVWPHKLALYNVAPLEVKAQVVHQGIADCLQFSALFMLKRDQMVSEFQRLSRKCCKMSKI